MADGDIGASLAQGFELSDAYANFLAGAMAVGLFILLNPSWFRDLIGILRENPLFSLFLAAGVYTIGYVSLYASVQILRGQEEGTNEMFADHLRERRDAGGIEERFLKQSEAAFDLDVDWDDDRASRESLLDLYWLTQLTVQNHPELKSEFKSDQAHARLFGALSFLFVLFIGAYTSRFLLQESVLRAFEWYFVENSVVTVAGSVLSCVRLLAPHVLERAPIWPVYIGLIYLVVVLPVLVVLLLKRSGLTTGGVRKRLRKATGNHERVPGPLLVLILVLVSCVVAFGVLGAPAPRETSDGGLIERECPELSGWYEGQVYFSISNGTDKPEENTLTVRLAGESRGTLRADTNGTYELRTDGNETVVLRTDDDATLEMRTTGNVSGTARVGDNGTVKPLSPNDTMTLPVSANDTVTLQVAGNGTTTLRSTGTEPSEERINGAYLLLGLVLTPFWYYSVKLRRNFQAEKINDMMFLFDIIQRREGEDAVKTDR